MHEEKEALLTDPACPLGLEARRVMGASGEFPVLCSAEAAPWGARIYVGRGRANGHAIPVRWTITGCVLLSIEEVREHVARLRAACPAAFELPGG